MFSSSVLQQVLRRKEAFATNLRRACFSHTSAAAAVDKKFVASESCDVPSAWYNIQADLPVPLPPPLHPGELRPCGPEDFAPLRSLILWFYLAE